MCADEILTTGTLSEATRSRSHTHTHMLHVRLK